MQRGSRRDARDARARVPRTGVAVGIAALLGVLGFLTAGSIAGAASHTKATVSVRTTPLGTILVNPSGHSLYMFKNDRNGKSTCSGDCAKFWPPLIAHGKPTAGPGAKSALLGTTKRHDGRLQVTYRKHPLYTFAPDKQPGQVNGQGSGGVWYVMSVGGAPIVKALATTAPTTTTTSPDGTTTPGVTTTTPATTTTPGDTTTAPSTTTTGTTTAPPTTMTTPYGY
jgi:predicted lipoprotein with Yx(FWY)xxD motif